MSSNKPILVIDAGNTSVKVGKFINNELIEVNRFELNSPEILVEYIEKTIPEKLVISSVLSEKDTDFLMSFFPDTILLDNNVIFPIEIEYETRATLGMDRICNAVFCFKQNQGKVSVCVDIGTCIKFDIIDQNGVYRGGSISPGIDLRYKTLHHFTGKLPLLSNKTLPFIVGNSTSTSIQSGVMNGILAEITGIMAFYRETYPQLTFFVTGGDAHYFELDSKNVIFADENLTLKGLYEIYKYNL